MAAVVKKMDYKERLDLHVDMCRKFLEVCLKSQNDDEVGSLRMLTALSSALAVEISDFKAKKQIGPPASAKLDEKIKPMPTARGPDKAKRKAKAKK